jgi:hypothetical protein
MLDSFEVVSEMVGSMGAKTAKKTCAKKAKIRVSTCSTFNIIIIELNHRRCPAVSEFLLDPFVQELTLLGLPSAANRELGIADLVAQV